MEPQMNVDEHRYENGLKIIRVNLCLSVVKSKLMAIQT